MIPRPNFLTTAQATKNEEESTEPVRILILFELEI